MDELTLSSDEILKQKHEKLKTKIKKTKEILRRTPPNKGDVIYAASKFLESNVIDMSIAKTDKKWYHNLID
jgi:hypothetical protein